MSQKWVKARAADVRTTWTQRERRQRAIAGQVRCRELLARLGLLGDHRGAQWETRCER